MSHPLFALPGGIHPPAHKTRSTGAPVAPASLPPQLFVSLAQHAGKPAKPVVAPGDKILKGQLVAVADGVFSLPVHAPSSGVISTIDNFPQAHPSGLAAPCIVIDTDGADRWTPLTPLPHWQDLGKAELLDRIRDAGVAGLGGAGFPTAVKLNPRSTLPIDTLIINGAECEPYITADDMLMRERAAEVIAGTLLVAHLLNEPARLVIGVEDNKPEAISALRKAAEGSQVEVAVFPTRYPSGGARQLTWILTGREIPHGHHSAEAGVICLNVATVAAAWRAVTLGEPLISRIVTLAGDALREERNLEVLIGTPIHFLLEQQGLQPGALSRLVVGGPMMGFTLTNTEAPVIKTTNCLIAAGRKELPLPPPAQACIRCGYCADACPAGLLPQQLYWYARAGDQDRLKSHHLFDCIECGACSWVCPSSIPLVQYYRAAKGAIQDAEQEKEKAERSRRRFEFRQQRIEQEEATKEAKRLARKQAAEAARAQLARKAEQQGEARSDVIASDTVITPALVRTGSDAPAEQRARLERILAAAKNTLEHASKPLEPREGGQEITPEKLEKQQARIKQAELRVHEAEKKLAAFLASEAADSTAAAPSLASDTTDPLERARNKLARTPRQKLTAALETLERQLEKARTLAASDPGNGALTEGVRVLEQKIATTRAELDSLGSEADQPSTLSGPEQQAAEAAIDKARQRLPARAEQDPAEQRAGRREKLVSRLEKTRTLLKQAEADQAPTVAALQKSIQRLEEQLQRLQEES